MYLGNPPYRKKRRRMEPLWCCESKKESGKGGPPAKNDAPTFSVIMWGIRMTFSPSTLSEIESALKEYCNIVLTSDLSGASQAIYIDQANNFVRWLKGEFVPGARVNPFPMKRTRSSTP